MLDEDKIRELKASVEGLLESFELTQGECCSLPSLAKGVVRGFFHDEIKRAKILLERIKESDRNAAAAQASADQLR